MPSRVSPSAIALAPLPARYSAKIRPITFSSVGVWGEGVLSLAVSGHGRVGVRADVDEL
jgi:hypothetical protein